MTEINTPSDLALPRVFIAEFMCGGGLFDSPTQSIPGPLLGEGTAMWRCLVDDFSAWADVRTPVDPRLMLPMPASDRVQCVAMESCTAPWAQWIEAARDCDFAVLVVPETDGLLTKGISLMRAAAIEVLAPTGAAIGVTADKWATAKWLHQQGIAHPDTWSIERVPRGKQQPSYSCSRLTSPAPNSAERNDSVFGRFPENGYLVKPRDGCGAMDIRRYDELEPALASMQTHEITQQRLSGRPASVIVIGHRTTTDRVMLPAVWQDIEEVPHHPRGDDVGNPQPSQTTSSHLIYRGGCGPVPAEMQLRAHALVDRVLQALPGRLSGFVGIDLILGSDANHDAVIEVNPRLTTSYVGLRKMSAENLTQRVFQTSRHSPRISVATESVTWDVQSLLTQLTAAI